MKEGAFISPPGIDEVSVDRLPYCSADFCKQKVKSYEYPGAAPPKLFHGLSSILMENLLYTGADARSSPQESNPAHADIFYGIVVQRGEPLPTAIKAIIKEILVYARYFQDHNVASMIWDSGDLSDC